MADDPNITSDPVEEVAAIACKEDAETTAARRELKQTSISEKGGVRPDSCADKSGSEEDDETPEEKDETKAAERKNTLDLKPPSSDDGPKEQLSSPKKKRAHDEFDENDGERKDEGGSTEQGKEAWSCANGSAVVSRTDRSEPEKKRARDEPEEAASDDKQAQTASEPAQPQTTTDEVESKPEEMNKDNEKESKPQTSSAAFAKSPFAKLAGSSTSGFGALGAAATAKPSPFSPAAASPFAALAGSKPATAPAPTKLTFGSANAVSSPFASAGLSAGLNGSAKSSGFGFGSGFGGAAAGPRLTSFASSGKPGDLAKSEKPAKPFGAPDSDSEEDGEDGEEGEDEESEAMADKADKEDEQEKSKDDIKSPPEDAKKPKLQKIVVDDGESNEATVLAVRAKMFLMDKALGGWKERGAGMLKLNVPKATIEFDDAGNAEISSFDASAIEAEGEDEKAEARQNVRLIMRQDQTHRLILNTTVVPAMKFQLMPKLKSATVLFTAFEANEAVQVQMKMSEANSTLFMDQIGFIQKRLADV